MPLCSFSAGESRTVGFPAERDIEVDSILRDNWQNGFGPAGSLNLK
jgi:hypothetical protein